jgi:hypothetical protein
LTTPLKVRLLNNLTGQEKTEGISFESLHIDQSVSFEKSKGPMFPDPVPDYNSRSPYLEGVAVVQ